MKTSDHSCFQFLTLNYAAWEDLMDTPLDNSDMDIFTDGSSFVQDGKWKVGYPVVRSEQVLEVNSNYNDWEQLGSCLKKYAM